MIEDENLSEVEPEEDTTTTHVDTLQSDTLQEGGRPKMKANKITGYHQYLRDISVSDISTS